MYGARFATLVDFYNHTANNCSELSRRMAHTDILYSCMQFAQATLPYLYEIESNHRNALLSIGQEEDPKIRIRRGLGKSISRLANVLYGVVSNWDIESIFKNIEELVQNRQQHTNILEEKIRIVQTEVSEANATFQHILKNEQKIEGNLVFLQTQLMLNTENINEMQIKETLVEQALLFEISLNQYAYETQNLIAIVNSALQGKIHTSVFPTRRLLAEFTEIKMNLPSGVSLPLDIRKETIPEYHRISEISIFHESKYLIFRIRIPLILNDNYYAYHPIPLPIPMENNSLVLISPESDHLVFSSDSEKYFTLTQDQWEMCLDLRLFKLCKGGQPVHRRVKSNLCEVDLFKSRQNLPKSCHIKYIQTNTPVWNRIPETNSWLFFTQAEGGAIVCTNPEQSFDIEFSGVGRLTTSSRCEIHHLNSIMSPLINDKNTNLDLVPSSQGDNKLSTLLETLDDVIPQSITNTDAFKTLELLARHAMSIDRLHHKASKHLIFVALEVHIVIVYVSLIGIIIIIVIIFKRKNVKMYKPELAEIEATQDISTDNL